MFLNDSTLNTSQKQAEIEVQENVKTYTDKILKKKKKQNDGNNSISEMYQE